MSFKACLTSFLGMKRRASLCMTTSSFRSSLVTNQYYQRFIERARQAGANLNANFNILAELFAKQCNAIAAMRIRRALQIMLLYQKLGYDERALQKLIERLGKNVFKGGKAKPMYLLFGAGFLMVEKDCIKEEEMRKTAAEITKLVSKSHRGIQRESSQPQTSPPTLEGWESLIEKDELRVWRRPIPDTYLFEYKVYGTYSDVSARAFYNAQLDLDFRKQWDKLVIKLEMVEHDEKTSCEVVQWIMHYPYPMRSREYVYIRRSMVDQKQGVMVIMSRSTNHPSCPVTEEYVRVNTYQSNMVIRPHGSFDENGFDYILNYYDDPKSAFPSVAYNWMARSGVPDFVEKMHVAAQQLQERKRSSLKNANNNSSSSGYDEKIPI